MRNWLAITAGTALLAGCGNPAGRDASDQRKAEGEVLGGTISDGMIPLEAVTSQSPALGPSAATAADGAEGGAEATDVEDGEAGEGGASAVSPQVSPAPLANPAE